MKGNFTMFLSGMEKGESFMEYRTKAAVVMAFIFFFLLATVSAIYFGVKISEADRADKTFEGGVMVEHVMESEKDCI